MTSLTERKTVLPDDKTEQTTQPTSLKQSFKFKLAHILDIVLDVLRKYCQARFICTMPSGRYAVLCCDIRKRMQN